MLVITSPGPPQSKFKIKGTSQWLFDGETFWNAPNQEMLGAIDRTASPAACVIGSGETAAAVVVQLTRLLPRGSRMSGLPGEGSSTTPGRKSRGEPALPRPRELARVPERGPRGIRPPHRSRSVLRGQQGNRKSRPTGSARSPERSRASRSTRSISISNSTTATTPSPTL